MGFIITKSWYEIAIWVVMIFNLSISSDSFSTAINKPTHLTLNPQDDFLYSFWRKSISRRPHSGVPYNISLQANYAGIEVSVLILRGRTLWTKGVNFSSFNLPPKLITMPHVKRVAIMYQNLGNFSSHFYDLPGFQFLTSVVGLAMYDATDLRREERSLRLNTTLMGKPVMVKFPRIQVPQGRDPKLMKCVRFGPSSSLVELSNMVGHGVCSSKDIGKFAIVMPVVNGTTLSPSSLLRRRRRKAKPWIYWVIGVGVGLCGMVLVVSIGLLGYGTIVSRKIKGMESKSENGESLGITWIGNSKLPTAPMTRTQSVSIEMDLEP